MTQSNKRTFAVIFDKSGRTQGAYFDEQKGADAEALEQAKLLPFGTVIMVGWFELPDFRTRPDGVSLETWVMTQLELLRTQKDMINVLYWLQRTDSGLWRSEPDPDRTRQRWFRTGSDKD